MLEALETAGPGRVEAAEDAHWALRLGLRLLLLYLLVPPVAPAPRPPAAPDSALMLLDATRPEASSHHHRLRDARAASDAFWHMIAEQRQSSSGPCSGPCSNFVNYDVNCEIVDYETTVFSQLRGYEIQSTNRSQSAI